MLRPLKWGETPTRCWAVFAVKSDSTNWSDDGTRTDTSKNMRADADLFTWEVLDRAAITE